MKQNKLIFTALGLGALLLALRFGLYAVAVDEKNLLESGHILSLLIWAVAGLSLALALFGGLTCRTGGDAPTGTPIAALGDVIFALAIGITVFSLGTPFTLLEKARAVVGFLCIPCLGWAAFCRFKSKPVFFGCFALVCVFFSLYLVSFYRIWSGNPQLQDYAFRMLTCITAALFSYQCSALAVGIGSRKLWLFSGLLAACCGLAALCKADNGLLYGAAAMWALTSLIRKREEP